jgi:hypothetical protein
MTSATVASGSRYDARTIVVGGIQLGMVTAGGVVLFALLSRAMTGTVEAIVQSLIVLLGGAVVTYWPAAIVRPRDVDTIGWTTLLAYVGTVVFTILDIALLRPLGMYHWTWDAIGGGSGFWYISIWWMGGTFLAWMGAWTYAIQTRTGAAPSVVRMALRTVGTALLLYIVVDVLRGRPQPALAALAYVVMAVLGVPVAAFTGGRR